MAARTTVKRGVCSGNLTTRPTRALAGLYLGGSDRFAGLPPGGQGGNRSRTRPPAACCPRPHVTSHLSQQVSLVLDPSSLSLSPPRSHEFIARKKYSKRFPPLSEPTGFFWPWSFSSSSSLQSSKLISNTTVSNRLQPAFSTSVWCYCITVYHSVL